jgi:hypothetical protein
LRLGAEAKTKQAKDGPANGRRGDHGWRLSPERGPQARKRRPRFRRRHM